MRSVISSRLTRYSPVANRTGIKLTVFFVPSLQVTVKIFAILCPGVVFFTFLTHPDIAATRSLMSGNAFLYQILPLGASFRSYPKSSVNLGFK